MRRLCQTLLKTLRGLAPGQGLLLALLRAHALRQGPVTRRVMPALLHRVLQQHAKERPVVSWEQGRHQEQRNVPQRQERQALACTSGRVCRGCSQGSGRRAQQLQQLHVRASGSAAMQDRRPPRDRALLRQAKLGGHAHRLRAM